MGTRLHVTLLILACLLIAAPAHAWRARTLDKYQALPIVKAQDLAKPMRFDAKGGAVSAKASLRPGYYSLWVYAREATAGDRRPVVLELWLNGALHSRQRVPYIEILQPVTRLQFRANGDTTLDLRTGRGTTGAVVVERIEIRDEIPNRTDKPLKREPVYAAQPPIVTSYPVADGLPEFFDNVAASLPPVNALFGDCDKLVTDEIKALAKELGKPGYMMTPWDKPWALVNAETGDRYDIEDYMAGEPYAGGPFRRRGKPSVGGLPDAGGGYFVSKGTLGVPAEPIPDGLAKSHGDIGVVQAAGRDLTLTSLAPIFGARLREVEQALDSEVANYVKTGEPMAARRATLILAALADRAASFDPRTQSAMHNFGYWEFTRWARHAASGVDYTALAKAYDQLFTWIVGDEKLAALVGRRVPWVKTAADLRAFFDSTLLLQGLSKHWRYQRTGMQTGWEQRTVPIIRILGPCDEGKRAMERFLQEECFADLSANAGWIDHLASGYNRDGNNLNGGAEYTKASCNGVILLARELAQAKAQGFDVHPYAYDPQVNPRLVKAAYWLLRYRSAGGYSCYLGEWSDMFSQKRQLITASADYRRAYYQAFEWTGDAAFAALLKAWGQDGLTEGEWAKVTTAAGDIENPILHTQSRVLPGFGFTALELNSASSDVLKKGSVLLRHGGGRGHAHGDLLDVSLNAYGFRVCGDGGRAFWPWPRFTSQHNTVEVDRSSFQATCSNSGAFGYPLCFKPFDGTGPQFATAGGWCSTHPQLKSYTRDVVMVPVGDAYYMVSVSRVDGGKVHTYCWHGPASDTYSTNSGEAATDKDPLNLMDRCSDWQTGVAKSPFVVDWRMLDKFSNKRDIHVRHTAFDIGDQRFYMARGTGSYTRGVPFLWSERVSKWPMKSNFLSVTEPYEGVPNLASVRPLASLDASVAGAASVRGVEVTTADGRHDIVLASEKPDYHCTIGPVAADGRFSFISEDKDGLVEAVLIGGTTLKYKDIALTAAKPSEEHVIPVALAGLTLPKGGEWTVGRAPHLVGSADPIGELQRHEAVIFSSPIASVDEKAGAVVPANSLTWTAAEPNYYQGCSATNESRTKWWKVRTEVTEMWMPLFTPISDADVTDANGDGVRMVKLTNFAPPEAVRDPVIRFYGPFTKPVRWQQMNRKPFAEPVWLEVTRVDAARRRLYFKPPTNDYDLLNNPWVYSGTTISNEAGTRTWRGNYPAHEFRIVLEGAAVRDADFTDADGDGRRRILLTDFGPGDPMRRDTHVRITRALPGVYIVDADVAHTVTLPKGVRVGK